MHDKVQDPARRRLLHAGAATLAATAVLGPFGAASAEEAWPNRPLRIIVPYAAGQGADVLMRLMARELSQSLNQSIVVENRGGAGGNIGVATAARSAPDGYTFVLGTNATHAANEFLYSSLGFNPSADFDGVAMLGLLPMVFVTSAPDIPANGVAQLIAQSRAKPNALNVGLPSTTANVVLAQFVKTAQSPLFGVKYKSSGQSMADVLGGQIPLAIDTVTAARSQISSGKLRAVGITSAKPSEMLPGVKSVAEQGVPGFEVVAWDALFAPRGTPPEVIRKMSEHIQRAQQQAEMRARMLDIGVEPLTMSPSQLDAFVKTERSKWGEIIKLADISVD